MSNQYRRERMLTSQLREQIEPRLHQLLDAFENDIQNELSNERQTYENRILHLSSTIASMQRQLDEASVAMAGLSTLADTKQRLVEAEATIERNRMVEVENAELRRQVGELKGRLSSEAASVGALNRLRVELNGKDNEVLLLKAKALEARKLMKQMSNVLKDKSEFINKRGSISSGSSTFL